METSAKEEGPLERVWHSENFRIKSEKLNSDIQHLPFGDFDRSHIHIQRVPT